MSDTGEINKMNKMGPSTEPCGTPHVQGEIEDLYRPIKHIDFYWTGKMKSIE